MYLGTPWPILVGQPIKMISGQSGRTISQNFQNSTKKKNQNQASITGNYGIENPGFLPLYIFCILEENIITFLDLTFLLFFHFINFNFSVLLFNPQRSPHGFHGLNIISSRQLLSEFFVILCILYFRSILLKFVESLTLTLKFSTNPELLTTRSIHLKKTQNQTS